jgi:hypothetical protein
LLHRESRAAELCKKAIDSLNGGVGNFTALLRLEESPRLVDALSDKLNNVLGTDNVDKCVTSILVCILVNFSAVAREGSGSSDSDVFGTDNVDKCVTNILECILVNFSAVAREGSVPRDRPDLELSAVGNVPQHDCGSNVNASLDLC